MAGVFSIPGAPKSYNTIELRDFAHSSLANIFKPGLRYRRAGVTFGGLELAEWVSLQLWENEHYERHR